MKPNYSLWEHWWYLGKINCKWVEQLQELCFDRKELFGSEQLYLSIMDSLKEIYETQPQVVNGKAWKKECPKSTIERLIKKGLLAGGIEELLVHTECLEMMRINIMIDTTRSPTERWKLITELVRKFPEEGKYIDDWKKEEEQRKKQEEQDLDVREIEYEGKKYYICDTGEYKDVVFSIEKQEEIGKKVGDEIQFY